MAVGAQHRQDQAQVVTAGSCADSISLGSKALWDGPLNEVFGVEAVDGSGCFQDVEAGEAIDSGEVCF